MNVADYLLHNTITDKTAIIGEDASHTYAEIVDAVNGMAKNLRALGVQKGDCVGIFADKLALLGRRPHRHDEGRRHHLPLCPTQ